MCMFGVGREGGADGEEGHWEDRCNSDFVIWRLD